MDDNATHRTYQLWHRPFVVSDVFSINWISRGDLVWHRGVFMDQRTSKSIKSRTKIEVMSIAGK